MRTRSDRNILLLMIGVAGTSKNIDEGINGITRLQKFLFLLGEEKKKGDDNEGYQFQPYKAGPYSPDIYDDLEFLENLGFIKSEVTGTATKEEAADIDFSFEELMEGDESRAADAYDEKRFSLTEKGEEKIRLLMTSENYSAVVQGIREIKSKYGSYSLSDLLYYVYTKYPEWTTESEIKDQVLHRGRSR